MRVLGIDPALVSTGYCVIDAMRGKFTLVAEGLIKTTPAMPMNDRLRTIFHAVSHLAHTLKPDRAAVEETYVNANARSSVLLAQARATAICGVFAAGDIPVTSITPTQIKKQMTGNGSSNKSLVAIAVRRLIPELIGARHDVTDAAAVALYEAMNAGLLQRIKGIPTGARSVELVKGRIIPARR